MKKHWTRRALIGKSLAAAGAAAGAKLAGIVPEFGLTAQAAGASSTEVPAYAQKPQFQAEYKGKAKADLLAKVADSPDVQEVLRQLNRTGPLDLTGVETHAVRSEFAGGNIVIAVTAVLDEQHVLAHYSSSGPADPGSPSHAFVHQVTADRKSEVVAASANGRQMVRSAEPATVPAGSALAASSCPWCYYGCGQSCCGYDWWGILECCVACSVFWECPPCFLGCALAWCGACVWFHCWHCQNCCQYWWC